MNTLLAISNFVSKGKYIMWFFTMNMIALIWYATAKEIKIDSSVATMYCGALTTYIFSKGHELYEQKKTERQKLREGVKDASD